MFKLFLAAGCALVTLVSTPAHSQGQLLENGRSGFGAALGLSQTETDAGTVFTTGVNGGISLRGLLDLGVGVQRSTLDHKTIGEFSETGYQPSITVHLLRQNAKMPITLSAGLAYYWGKIESDALDLLGWETSGSGPIATGAIQSRVSLTPAFFVIPQGSVSYSSRKVTITGRYGASSSNTGTTTAFDVGVALCVKPASKLIFTMTPHVTFGDNTTLGLSAGMVLTD